MDLRDSSTNPTTCFLMRTRPNSLDCWLQTQEMTAWEWPNKNQQTSGWWWPLWLRGSLTIGWTARAGSASCDNSITYTPVGLKCRNCPLLDPPILHPPQPTQILDGPLQFLLLPLPAVPQNKTLHHQFLLTHSLVCLTQFIPKWNIKELKYTEILNSQRSVENAIVLDFQFGPFRPQIETCQCEIYLGLPPYNYACGCSTDELSFLLFLNPHSSSQNKMDN